jgi:hypothetical protein
MILSTLATIGALFTPLPSATPFNSPPLLTPTSIAQVLSDAKGREEARDLSFLIQHDLGMAVKTQWCYGCEGTVSYAPSATETTSFKYVTIYTSNSLWAKFRVDATIEATASIPGENCTDSFFCNNNSCFALIYFEATAYGYYISGDPNHTFADLNTAVAAAGFWLEGPNGCYHDLTGHAQPKFCSNNFVTSGCGAIPGISREGSVQAIPQSPTKITVTLTCASCTNYL